MLSKVKHCSCFFPAGYVFSADELLISRSLQDSGGSQVQMTGDESLLSQALRTRAIADTAVSPQAILDKFFFMMLLLIPPIHFP
jgi:hypothetical protein